jgi:hypothetical protein
MMSMGKRTLLLACVSLVLEGSTACGGKAASAAYDADPPGMELPAGDLPEPDATLEEDAPLDTLVLRRVDARSAAATGSDCEFAERMKVYFSSHELVTRTCTDYPPGRREETALLDTDLERIRSAYAQLRPAAGERCEGSSGWLNLDVETLHHAADRQWSDVEHSGCPLEELEGRSLADGLGPLYRLLVDLRAP